MMQLFLVQALVNLISGVLSSTELPFMVQHPNQLISPYEADFWTTKHDLALILFYNEVTSSGTVADVVYRFQRVGEKLNSYGAYFGVYNCGLHPTHNRCSEEQSSGITAYLKGLYTTELSIDSLFDEYSILSNSLQLLLSSKVPLLQTAEELTHHATQSQDFLLAVVKGVGSYEHAQYMDLAKTSIDAGIELSFAHSTDESITSQLSSGSSRHMTLKELGLHDEYAQLYYVNCGAMGSTDECSVYPYLGLFDSTSLSGYVQLLSFSGQLAEAVAMKLPMARCYYNNKDEQVAVEKLVGAMSEEFKGALLFYKLPSKEATEDESKSFSEMGAFCVIEDDSLGVKDNVQLDFVRDYLMDEVLAKRLKVEEKLDEELSEADAIIKAVEKADDTVDIMDHDLGGLADLDLSNLVILDRESFDTKRFTGVVLFHLMKYDYKNRVVLRLYNEAAANLTKGALSILDCYDWTDVCKKLKIAEFPTIRIYKRGAHVTYSGPLTAPAFIKMAQMKEFGYPHEVDSMTDVIKLRAKLMAMNVTLIVVGLFDDIGSKEYKAYREASRNLVGQYLLMQVTGKLAETLKMQLKLTSLPAIASYDVNEKDMNQAIVRFDQKTVSSKALESFVKRSTLPAFVEMTPSTLPLLQLSRQPQVLFFTLDLNGKAFSSLQLLSQDKSLKMHFGFGYLPLKDNSLNKRILRSLSGRVQSPVLLVCDYNKGKLFEYKSLMTLEDVNEWLRQVSSGKVEASRDLPTREWKAVHPGYDYLDLIEQEKRRKKAEHDRLNIIPHANTDDSPPSAAGNEIRQTHDMQDATEPTSAATDGGRPVTHTEL